jgi:hypothetical protein
MEQPFRISDEVGIPSTLGAVILNLMTMFNISNINMILTLIISGLSITYLLINISIKYRELKKLKKEEDSTS